MEYFRLPSDHTGLARPNPRGGLEIPGTVNFLKYHLAQRFHILTAHFEIRVITLYVTGMKIVELARTGSNGGSSRKSAQEKSCSLPIIYLLLLFLSSICIKYLNWEIPNVHNLQQASNPGIIIVWIPRILDIKEIRGCHKIMLNSRVEHNTWICYGKYYHIKERQHQTRSAASCRSTRNGNVIKNLIPMAWGL